MPVVISGTNGVSGVDGTASNPSYEGTDSNTGIFFPAADTVAIATGGTQRLTVNSSGNTQTVGTISVGNATPSTSGAGITFPATQSASSDANTLDDYEEGSWTPTITYTTPGTLSVSYSSQAGTYTKVGNIVTLSFGIRISAFTKGTASGDLRVGGVPFTTDFDTAIGTVGLFNSSFTSQPVLVPTTGAFNLLRLVNNSGWVSLDDPDSNAQYFGTVVMRVA
jgi:hypothetical protein